MQYATLRHSAPVPDDVSPPRMRRNTMEPRGRQQQMIQLVRASQQQQYAYEYIDDRGSFVRTQKAEEERIQQDVERALRAQRRNKARKVARASKVAEQATNTTPVRDWHQDINHRYANMAPNPPQVDSRERSRLERFKFPPLEIIEAPPVRFTQRVQHLIPLPSPTKRLTPIPRFNPFVRARSESLSSLIENEPPVNDPGKRKRNASVSALFARIHREAENMRRRG